jgi:TRAP-type transport system small permease protein
VVIQLKKISKLANGTLNILVVLSLAMMSILVFGNVVLRYIFNSGITWSEEMSRFLFVWMVFLGAIAALRENMHLGVDIVINALPRKAKKVVFIISNLLVLYVLWLLLNGSWKMAVLNMNSKAPATGTPLGLVYGIGVVTSVGMAIIVLTNMFQTLLVRNGSLSMISNSDKAIATGTADGYNQKTNVNNSTKLTI